MEDIEEKIENYYMNEMVPMDEKLDTLIAEDVDEIDDIIYAMFLSDRVTVLFPEKNQAVYICWSRHGEGYVVFDDGWFGVDDAKPGRLDRYHTDESASKFIWFEKNLQSRLFNCITHEIDELDIGCNVTGINDRLLDDETFADRNLALLETDRGLVLYDVDGMEPVVTGICERGIDSDTLAVFGMVVFDLTDGAVILDRNLRDVFRTDSTGLSIFTSNDGLCLISNAEDDLVELVYIEDDDFAIIDEAEFSQDTRFSFVENDENGDMFYAYTEKNGKRDVVAFVKSNGRDSRFEYPGDDSGLKLAAYLAEI